MVPQYDIRGSITQFDEDVTREQAGLGASIVSAVTGPLFGVRFNRTQQSSVMGFDAGVISTTDLSLVPGASSKNTIVVHRDETSAGDGLAQIRNSSLSFNFVVSRNEGVAQSLRNMVELATIELTGKLLRLPYWSCLKLDPAHPEIQREMQDWFLSMQGSVETDALLPGAAALSQVLRRPDRTASPTRRTPRRWPPTARRLGVHSDGEPDFEVWQAFLLRDDSGATAAALRGRQVSRRRRTGKPRSSCRCRSRRRATARATRSSCR